MSKITLVAMAVGCIVFNATPLHAQTSDAKRKIGLVQGPARAQLKDVAQVEVPEGYVFIDGNGLRALLKKAGEPTSGNELGLLRPTNHSWSVIFEFSADGYVKDDEKNNLNADKILASIKAANAEANKERVKNGNAPLEVGRLGTTAQV
jgi:uncharacterized membrane-anchored protein